MSHQVIRGPDALTALVTQLDVPAGCQQDRQVRLHAHRAELIPILLISGDDNAAPAVAAGTVGGTTVRRCYDASRDGDGLNGCHLQLG